MPVVRGAPPGRAGRLWLRDRLRTARRGADLLDRKLRILRAEQQRVALAAERSAEQWERSCRDAETWLLRAASLGGQRALRPPAGLPPAEVEVHWASVMGVRYPDSTTYRQPPELLDPPTVASAAIPPMVAAYRAATEAAVAHAAALAATRIVAAEVATTRRRLRAVRDRWLPRLAGELAALELGLDELERAEGIRRRWAAGQRLGQPLAAASQDEAAEAAAEEASEP